MSEGKGNRVHTFQPYASWESVQHWPEAKSQPMKTQKQHDFYFPNLLPSNDPTADCTPPPVSFTRTNKKHWAVFYLKASMWGSLSTGSKLGQEQRGNMLLSPVCVPSVRKFHQQHKLDHQENEAADGSHIAPHCEIGGRNKVKQSRFFKCCIVLRCCTIVLLKKWPVVTFQKCFLFWEEEASSTACYQCNKLQQPEPDNQTSNIIKR